MQAKRVMWLALGAAVLVAFSSLVATLVAWRLAPRLAQTRPASTATVIIGVQSLSQLVTVKYVLEKVVVFEDPKFLGGVIPLGENRLILLAHGEVRAGVDLADLKESDVSISGRRVTLTLPKGVVLDAHLVEQRTQVLDYKTGLLVPFDKNLEQTARRFALAEISRAARQNGIEAEALERARKQLSRFLESLGFTQVEIRVRNP